MVYRLPPLSPLRLFEAAARNLSFKRAAEELGLTPSALSHGIDGLETWLGVDLFERKGRSLRLTEAGTDFLPYVAEGLSMIATGARRISPHLGERRVSVSVAPTFARLWLAPRLSGFRARHPDVQIRIDTNHRQAVFPLDGVDLAIRMGPGPWPGERSELLFREALLPVAAESYVIEHGGTEGTVDWRSIDLIHVSSVEHDWDTWLAAQGLAAAGRHHLHFDNIELAIDAAANGLGIALCRLPLCQALLDVRAVRPLDFKPLPIQTGYWVTGPAGKEPRREVDSFRRWIGEEMAGSFK